MIKTMVLTTILMIFLVSLTAQDLGKIRFVLGDVQYRSNQNSPWKVAAINTVIESNSSIKTGLDSSVEILWSSNLSSTLGANKTTVMRSLYDETHQKQKWVTQIKGKANTMNLQTKQKATTVAGIRRDEVVIKSQSELYWDMDPLLKVDDAIALYEAKKYADAIALFQKVIEQGPLKKDAEIAHTYLIVIYQEQANTPALKEQIKTLKADFPNSEILDSIPQDI